MPARAYEVSDSALVEAYVHGDQQAFAEIVARYQSKLRRFVFGLIQDDAKTEDLVQEIFIRVDKHAARFDQSKTFSTWIYTIAKNLATNERRNRSRNPVLFLGNPGVGSYDASDKKASPERHYELNRLLDVVERGVMALSPDHRIIFELRERRGLTYDKISEIIGVPIGTVKSRIFRAREHFKQTVKPEYRRSA